LVPQEERVGGVGLIDASEEAGVSAAGVSVDGTNSCDIWVEFGSRLSSGARVHGKVEGFLYRSTRGRGQLISVPTSVFGKASVRLLRGEIKFMKTLTPLAISWSRTYDHGSQVVRAVVVRSCPLSFERLFAISIDLVLVNSVKVFAKNIDSSIVVANQDFEGADLVEVERAVVANKERGQ